MNRRAAVVLLVAGTAAAIGSRRRGDRRERVAPPVAPPVAEEPLPLLAEWRSILARARWAPLRRVADVPLPGGTERAEGWSLGDGRVLVLSIVLNDLHVGVGSDGKYSLKGKLDHERSLALNVLGFGVLDVSDHPQLALWAGHKRRRGLSLDAQGRWHVAERLASADLARLTVAELGEPSDHFGDSERRYYAGPVAIVDGLGRKLDTVTLPDGLVAVDAHASRDGRATRVGLRVAHRRNDVWPPHGTGEEMPSAGLVLSEVVDGTRRQIVLPPTDERFTAWLPKGAGLTLTDSCWCGTTMADGVIVRGETRVHREHEDLAAVLLWRVTGERSDLLAVLARHERDGVARSDFRPAEGGGVAEVVTAEPPSDDYTARPVVPQMPQYWQMRPTVSADGTVCFVTDDAVWATTQPAT